MRIDVRFVLAVIVLLLSVPAPSATKNGFELDDPLIPVDEIVSGGPPRDGIPAINEPKFVDPDAAGFMDDDDRVMGVVIDGVPRAYPIKILNWHEAVNDQIGTQYFVVTYCPLCGTGMVFAANAGDDGRLLFGISGLLYDSDVLLFDRNTESLWSQLMGKAVSGPLKGTDLPQLPARHTTWADWQERHPGSQVLSTDSGFGRNYERSPYNDYGRSRRLYFDVSNKAPRGLHTKEMVLGVELGGSAKAYPFPRLEENGEQVIEDTIDGRPVRIHWNEQAETAWATDKHGNEIPTVMAYWFAWYTFNPGTALFEVD